MVSIDHHSFPHIFEAILSNVPRDELWSLRCLSRGVRDFVDAHLAQHVVLSPLQLTLDHIFPLFGAEPPPVAAAVGVLCAVDLYAPRPSRFVPSSKSTWRPWKMDILRCRTILGLGIPYFKTAPIAQDKIHLRPAIEQRLARDEVALARTQIVDLIGYVLPSYWGLIPRARTVRIFPSPQRPHIEDSALLALQAIRPDTVVLFTCPTRQQPPDNSSAPRHRQFPRTRRLVVHVTPSADAYDPDPRGYEVRSEPVEVWTPPGRGGFQADDEIVYIFHEHWSRAWRDSSPPAYRWNIGYPHGRPHRSVPLPTTEWGHMSFLTPLFVALGEALENVSRVTIVGLDEINLRALLLRSPYKQERIRVLRQVPKQVMYRIHRVMGWSEESLSYRDPADKMDTADDDTEIIYASDRETEKMYRLALSDVVKDPHATINDMRGWLDAQMRAKPADHLWDWEEKRKSDAQKRHDKFRQFLCDCMWHASREQHQPNDPDQVLWFQPPAAWGRDRFNALIHDKVSFLTPDEYRDLVGDEQWRIETTTYPWHMRREDLRMRFRNTGMPRVRTPPRGPV